MHGVILIPELTGNTLVNISTENAETAGFLGLTGQAEKQNL